MQRQENTPHAQPSFLPSPSPIIVEKYSQNTVAIKVKSCLLAIFLCSVAYIEAQARYYDPGVGRFISADTIVPNANDPQSFNRYTYVRNNPLVYTDPSGHSFSLGNALSIAFPMFAPSLSYNAAAGNINNSADFKRYAYQAAAYNAGIGAAAAGLAFAPSMAGGLQSAFPGGWKGAGWVGKHWPYYVATTGAAWAADELGAEVSDQSGSMADQDRQAYINSRPRNPVHFDLLPGPRRQPRRELEIEFVLDEQPRVSLDLVGMGDYLSNAAFAANLTGAGLVLAGGPAGLAVSGAIGAGAAVLDVAAAGSYYADYQISGRSESLSNANLAIIGAGLDIGTANLGSVGAKAGRYGFQYSSRITGQFIRNDLGLMRGVRPHLQSLIYRRTTE